MAAGYRTRLAVIAARSGSGGAALWSATEVSEMRRLARHRGAAELVDDSGCFVGAPTKQPPVPPGRSGRRRLRPAGRVVGGVGGQDVSTAGGVDVHHVGGAAIAGDGARFAAGALEVCSHDRALPGLAPHPAVQRWIAQRWITRRRAEHHSVRTTLTTVGHPGNLPLAPRRPPDHTRRRAPRCP